MLSSEQLSRQLAWIEENSAAVQTSSVSSVPVHFYYIHNAVGRPPRLSYTFGYELDALNNALSGTLSFYRCKEDHIINDDFYSFSPQEAQALYDAFHDDEAFNVYVVEDFNGEKPSFFTYLPTDPARKNMIVMAPAATFNFPGGQFAFAVGIHCGLLPTYAGAFNGSCPPDPANPCAGDGICDTPVDPLPNYCSTCTGPVPCIVNCTNAQGTGYTYAYTPDIFNAMAYQFVRNCWNAASDYRLTAQQKAVIQNFANNYLDFTAINCQTAFLPELGDVSRYCDGSGWEGVGKIGVAMTNYSFNLTPQNYITPKTISDPPYRGKFNLNLHVFTPNDNLFFEPIKTQVFDNWTVMRPLNGVSTFDLLTISKHILGLESFSYAGQFFAADVNYSKSVTTFDIVEIRKVILGINDNFPTQTGSWRFIPKYYFLSDPSFSDDIWDISNPFLAEWTGVNPPRKYDFGANSFMDVLPISLTGNPYFSDPEAYSFWAVKTGDVNCSSFLGLQDEGGGGDYEFTYLPGDPVNVNEDFDIVFKVNSEIPLAAYQFAIRFDSSAVEVLSPQLGELPDFSVDNFGLTQLQRGRLRVLWYQPEGNVYDVSTDKTAFKLRCRALKPIADIAYAVRIEGSEFDNAFYNANGTEVSAQIKIQSSVLPLGLSANPNVLLYPNIFEESLFLHIKSERSDEIKVRLFDLFGHSVLRTYEVVAGANHIQLDIPNGLKPGLVSYQVEQNGRVASGKLLKQSLK